MASITPKITVACARSLIMSPNMTIDAMGTMMIEIDLEQVAQGVGVFERVRRVGPEEAAAVGAELLDGDFGRHGTDGDRLRAVLERGRLAAPCKVIGTPVATRQMATSTDSGTSTKQSPRSVSR